jgi:hypothetical protein
MIEGLPDYVAWLFILTTIITALIFVSAARKGNSRRSAVIVGSIFAFWLLSQAYVSWTGFYLDTQSLPPKMIFLVGPPLLLMLLLFLTKSGRKFIDSLSLPILTHLHVVRLFVEIGLYLLFIYKFVPELMTFEGRNFDIVAGVTAPIVAYLAFVTRKIGRGGLLAWNVICLLLVLNIVINGILAAPTPFQQFGFEQPNTGVLYFPFTWLPGFIVPVVIFSHLVAIRRLLREKRIANPVAESEAELL